MYQQLGSSLLEVLISFTLLAIMLLGFDAMQISSLREMKSAYYFSVATQQLNNMTEQLKILKNHFDGTTIIRWNQQNAKLLPQGRGKVTGSYPNFVLSIAWGKKSACHENKLGQSGCLHMAVKL